MLRGIILYYYITLFLSLDRTPEYHYHRYSLQ